MATNWADSTVVMVKNEDYIQKAQSLIPDLIHIERKPEKIYRLTNKQLHPCSDYESMKFARDEEIVFDFGHNAVGYIKVDCKSVGSPQDAPAFLKLRFCEVEKEIFTDADAYDGWLSKGWIQEEWLHIDRLPYTIDCQRRFTFRYLCIRVIDTSRKFWISFSNVTQQRISAVDERQLIPIDWEDGVINKIDEASIRTLANCMQKVFEDGPKRDRRLWLGDLWLQAKVNYKTFQNNDLVKRCLYLFAGMPSNRGQLAACVFTDDIPNMDDTFLLDYSLIFIAVLLDYYKATQDMDTLKELAPTAIKQVHIAMEYVDDSNLVEPEERYHCFIDWNDELDKQCSMQAILIYSIKQAIEICEILTMDSSELKCKCYDLEQAALRYLWKEQDQIFVSGRENQVSLASQIWMILAGVVTGDHAKSALKNVLASKISMTTPFLHHFYVEALYRCGEAAAAKEHIKSYWGGMIERGADTFWELFDPENPELSPYGSDSINSYCHAWSCTPAYFFRRTQS